MLRDENLNIFLSGFDLKSMSKTIKRNEKSNIYLNELSTIVRCFVMAIIRQQSINNAKRVVFFNNCILHDANKSIDMAGVFYEKIKKELENNIAVYRLIADDSDNHDDKESGWKDVEKDMFHKNVLITVLTESQKKFFSTYYYNNESRKLNANVFRINIYFDCSELLFKLADQNKSHLIIYKFFQDKCFSDALKDINYHCSNILSLTIISSSKINATIMQHDFAKSYTEINKDEDGSLFQRRIEHWVKLYLYPPSCFFSYAEKKGVHNYMAIMEKNIRRYFGFLKIEKDKTNNNLYANLGDYQNQLFNGDLVFCIIDELYLESFNPMHELLNVLNNKELLMEPECTSTYENYNNVKYRGFSGRGLFPLITKEAGEKYIYNANDNLKSKWADIISKNQNDTKHSRAELDAIYNSIDQIKDFLKTIYSHKNAEHHKEENFRNVAMEISKVISNHPRGYCNIYENYNEDNFPDISKLP